MKKLPLPVFNAETFSKDLKIKRMIEANIDLREAAKITGVSASTISRCENQGTPDLLTFFALCRWMGIPVNNYVKFQTKKNK